MPHSTTRTYDFVKQTKNFTLYQERGGFNKHYAPMMDPAPETITLTVTVAA